MSARSADTTLRRQAQLLQFAAVVTVLAAILNILRTSGLFPFLFAAVAGDGAAEGEILLRNLIGALPVFFYAAAVGTAGRIFGRIAAGEIFSGRNRGSIGSVGGNIMLGAVCALLVSPLLLAWIDGEAFDFQSEPQNMLLIVVGGLIQMLGLVLAKANAIRSELDQII
jgi:hypothetical protein